MECMAELLNVDAAKLQGLSREKQRRLKALAMSIRYITRQQQKKGGSVDGEDLPCIQHCWRRR